MTDFLSRLVEQGGGRLLGMRPLIAPFLAPTTSRPAQTILWSYLSTLPTTISPALASDEVMFPPEQPENFFMPADLVPEHLRQIPLPSPLIRNLLAVQEVVRPGNDEIAQDIFPEEEGDFGGRDLNTVEGDNVNLGRDHIHDVYDRREVAIRHQMPPHSTSELPEDVYDPEVRHKIAHIENQSVHHSPQPLPRSGDPASESRNAQSGLSAEAHHAFKKFTPERAHTDSVHNDTALPLHPQSLLLPGALAPDSIGHRQRKDRIDGTPDLRATVISPQLSPRLDASTPDSGRAPDDPAAEMQHLGELTSESRNAQPGLLAEVHPTTIEQFTQEKLPIDSVRNDTTLPPRLQSLPPSGALAPDSIGHRQRKDRIDGTPDLRATVISPQLSPRLDASTPDSGRAPDDPAAEMQHLGELTSESRNAQSGLSAEAHHAFKKFTPERAHTDSVHNDTTLPLHPQSLLLPGALAPDSVVLQKREHIDSIPDPGATATSPQPFPRPDDLIPESRSAQTSPSSGTQHSGVSTPGGHTTRRRFRIDGVHPARETPGRVDEHDAAITPVLPTMQQHTIVPQIGDEGKQKSAIQQPAAVASPPPVIHIRIGRVEVRAAIPESAPTSKSARASRPGLTLSEYMQQRKEHLQ